MTGSWEADLRMITLWCVWAAGMRGVFGSQPHQPIYMYDSKHSQILKVFDFSGMRKTGGVEEKSICSQPHRPIHEHGAKPDFESVGFFWNEEPWREKQRQPATPTHTWTRSTARYWKCLILPQEVKPERLEKKNLWHRRKPTHNSSQLLP